MPRDDETDRPARAPKTSLNERDFEGLCARVLEVAGLPRVPVQRARDGIGNDVFFAGDVVIRLGTGTDARMFPRATAVLRAARSTLRVPQVVFADVHGERLPLPVMVLSREPGVLAKRVWPELDHDGRWALLGSLADQLTKLHALDPAAIPDAEFPNPWWRDRADRIERWLGSSPPPGFPRAWFDALGRFYADHRAAFESSPPACVLHNDAHFGNVLVEGTRVTALLDFDDVITGPADEEAWHLLRAGESERGWTDLARFATLPGFDLADDGALDRYRLECVEGILEALAAEASWIDPTTAVTEACAEFGRVFRSDHFDRLRDGVLGGVG